MWRLEIRSQRLGLLDRDGSRRRDTGQSDPSFAGGGVEVETFNGDIDLCTEKKK